MSNDTGFSPLTCLRMSRARMFMTKPARRGYIVRDWMTVRISSMGRGVCSISCCITTASTSEVYTFFSPKHRLVATEEKRTTWKVMKKNIEKNDKKMKRGSDRVPTMLEPFTF